MNNKNQDTGEQIKWDDKGSIIVPDRPIVPFIEGDGTGPEIWAAARLVMDEAVNKAYQGQRCVVWTELMAGEKAQKIYGPDNPLPDQTLRAIANFRVAIKGPLTTPVGGGFRSLNVALRQKLDLYACVRPVRYIPGVPAPVKHPEKLDVVIFRENTEDVYTGIEYAAESIEASELIQLINRKAQATGRSTIPLESAIGIKPMSEKNTSRLVRKAIQYALENNRESLTLVHKGNIMKYTEGAFRDWGYKLARQEFPNETITEQELYDGLRVTSPATQTSPVSQRPQGKLVIKDRIADAMFQQLLLRPEEYDVIAAPNLNGDYLSDAAAAQVGGLGMAPGANLGDRCALFEATHGSAPKYAGQDKVNPGSLILSGVEMLRFMGWTEAAELIVNALTKTVSNKTVTYDLARQMQGAKELKCSEFAKAIAENM